MTNWLLKLNTDYLTPISLIATNSNTNTGKNYV